MKVALKLSFREVIIQASQCFCHLPHYSTLYYRAQKLNNTELQTLITSVAEEIMSTLNSKHLELVMADGTGFGYKDTVTLSFKRGQELRKVKSHVMTEVLVAHTKNLTFFLGVNTGKAYADEGKLLLEMLAKVRSRGILRGKYFLADSLYGNRVKVLENFKSLGFYLVVKTTETFRRKVRNPLRREAKETYETKKEIYKKRFRVEQVIGIVKECFGDRDNTKNFSLAQIKILIRFLAYNISLLILLGHSKPFFIFQTPSFAS